MSARNSITHRTHSTSFWSETGSMHFAQPNFAMQPANRCDILLTHSDAPAALDTGHPAQRTTGAFYFDRSGTN